jgi:hypothetical protein
VPKFWKEDPRFAIWVGNQRIAYWRDTLKPHRQHRLAQIGFDGLGGPHATVSWEDRFAQLAAFKARFGHCNVRCHWPEDPAFGNWVSTQRRFWKTGTLKADRMRQLEKIGFNRQLMFWKNNTPPRRLPRPAIRSELGALNRLWEKRLAALRKA